MIKILFATLLSGITLLLFSQEILAQNKNKVGINIGTNYGMADQAIATVGSGGWVVVIASPGDCNGLQDIIKRADANGVNVIIRGHLNNQLSPADAKGWAATLGNIKSNNMIYFMPWNEPNQEGTSDYGWVGDVKAYTNALIRDLNDTKLRGSKVFLLSPMVNQSHPNFSSYVANLGASYFNQFDGIAMNLYDVGSTSYTPFTNSNPNLNASQFEEVLGQIKASGKPAFAVESGTVLDGKVRYLAPQMSQFAQAMVNTTDANDNITMFALNAYDLAGEEGKKYNMFNTASAGILQHAGSGGSTTPNPDPTQEKEKTFRDWFNPLESSGELIQCAGCGYAPKENPGLCTGTAGGGVIKFYFPSRKVLTTDTSLSVSDDVLLYQNEKWPTSAVGSKGSTKGGFFDQFHDLTIPFARDLTQYLAGPFIYQAPDYIRRVLEANNPVYYRPLANLTPERLQHELRYKYWQGCRSGLFCSSINIPSTDCPTKENNECLTSDGITEIQNLCPPPLPEFTDLPSNCPADYDNWFNDWSDKWVNEVPFFSNPLTEIKESILMNTCPPPSHVSTTTRTRTPWVSALKDVSIILNQFFTSAMEQEEASPSSTSSLLRTKNQPKLLASADTASGKSNSPNPQPNPQNRNARLLAEGENPPLGLEITPEITPIGPNRFSVCWTLVGRQYDKNYNYCDWGYAVAVKVAGQEVGGFNEPMLGGHCFEWNPTITCTMGSARPIEVTAPNKDDIEVVVWITTGRCTGASCATIDPRTYLGSGLAAGAGVSLCLPPKVPDFVSPEGNEDPVTSEGHTLLKGKDEVIGCDAWSGTGNDFQCISPNKTLENDVKDPVWAEIKYPFLYTIYDNLSGPTNGLFVKLFKPNKIEANDWDYTAESRITYCLEDHPAPSMIKGGSLQIDKRIFYSPTARCETPLYTREIRAFPSYIGGVYNAKEWVKNEVLQPIIF